MGIGKAVTIFEKIESDNYTIEEKGMAIYMVLRMPTHNSITKNTFKKVLEWLWNQHFEYEETNEQNTEI